MAGKSLGKTPRVTRLLALLGLVLLSACTTPQSPPNATIREIHVEGDSDAFPLQVGDFQRTQVIAALLLLSLPLMGGMVWQLRAVGKAGDEILIPAFVIYPAYVILTVGWMAWDYSRKTRPRQKELEGLLADYKQPV